MYIQAVPVQYLKYFLVPLHIFSPVACLSIHIQMSDRCKTIFFPCSLFEHSHANVYRCETLEAVE